MSFRVLTASDDAWSDVLSRVPHDVYHLPGYARVCATHEPWEVRLAVSESADGVLALPFMLRDLPDSLSAPGVRDVTVPYGYPGPVCSSPDVGIQRSLFSETLEGFSAMGAISLFVRCHSYLGVSTEALAPFGDVVFHGHQVYIDLTEVGEPVVATFRADHRRNIRILRELGFEVRVDRPDDYAAFIGEYYSTMRRLSSDPYYLFPEAYFEAIRRELEGHVHLVTAAAPGGEPAAMALVFICGKMAQYHLSGTDEAFLRLAPSKLAVLGMAELCRDLGAETLNLGGGLGGRDDNLFKFKAGFSKLRKPFATGRFVLDRERYAALSADSRAPEGFFPAYRHGL